MIDVRITYYNSIFFATGTCTYATARWIIGPGRVVIRDAYRGAKHDLVYNGEMVFLDLAVSGRPWIVCPMPETL
jgi:hypothetical protein